MTVHATPLRASLRAFAEHGLESLTVAELADHLGTRRRLVRNCLTEAGDPGLITERRSA